VQGRRTTIRVEYQYSPTLYDGAIPSKIEAYSDDKLVEEATPVSFDRDTRTYVMRARPLPAGSPDIETLDLSQNE
jgi:hypothetical protein